MPKLIKFIGLFIIVLTILLGGIALSARWFLNSATLKQAVVKRIESKIGGTLSVKDLAIYPLPIARISLLNAHWTRTSPSLTADIETIVLTFPIYQLLASGTIDATLALKNPHISLEHSDQSAAPLGALGAITSPNPIQVPLPSSSEQSNWQQRLIQRIVIAKLDINQASLSSREDGKLTNIVDDMTLSAGPFSFDKPGNHSFSLHFPVLKVKGQSLSNGSATIAVHDGGVDISPFQFDAYEGHFTINGTVTALATTPQWRFTITATAFDPRLLPVRGIKEKLKGLEGKLTAKFNVSATGKDRYRLRQTLSGDGTIDALRVVIPEKKLRFDDIHLTGTVAENTLQIDALTAAFMGGSVRLQGPITNFRTHPGVALTATGTGLNLALLPSNGEKKASDYKVGGNASFNFSLSGAGATPEELRRALDAKGTFTVVDMPLPKTDFSSKMAPKRLPPILQEKARAQSEKIRPHIERILSVRKFDSVSGGLTRNAGNLTLSNVIAKNVNFEVHMGGTIAASKALNLAGDVYISPAQTKELLTTSGITAAIISGLTEADGRLRLPFTVTGTTNHAQPKLDFSEMMSKVVQSGLENKAVQEKIKEKIQQNIQEGGGPRKILRGVFGRPQ